MKIKAIARKRAIHLSIVVALASSLLSIAASPATATAPPEYSVGDTGPGGGTIFYYSADGFACGPNHTETASATGGSNVYLIGIAAVGQTGTVSFITDQKISVTGVQAVGYVGTVDPKANANIYLTGVQATGIIGNVLVWGQIPNNQDPNWTDIDDDSSSSWSQISNLETTEWELIAA